MINNDNKKKNHQNRLSTSFDFFSINKNSSSNDNNNNNNKMNLTMEEINRRLLNTSSTTTSVTMSEEEAHRQSLYSRISLGIKSPPYNQLIQQNGTISNSNQTQQQMSNPLILQSPPTQYFQRIGSKFEPLIPLVDKADYTGLAQSNNIFRQLDQIKSNVLQNSNILDSIPSSQIITSPKRSNFNESLLNLLDTKFNKLDESLGKIETKTINMNESLNSKLELLFNSIKEINENLLIMNRDSNELSDKVDYVNEILKKDRNRLNKMLNLSSKLKMANSILKRYKLTNRRKNKTKMRTANNVSYSHNITEMIYYDINEDIKSSNRTILSKLNSPAKKSILKKSYVNNDKNNLVEECNDLIKNKCVLNESSRSMAYSSSTKSLEYIKNDENDEHESESQDPHEDLDYDFFFSI